MPDAFTMDRTVTATPLSSVPARSLYNGAAPSSPPKYRGWKHSPRSRAPQLASYASATTAAPQFTVRPHDEFTRTPPPPTAPPPAISTDKEAELLTLDETWAKIAAKLADEMQTLCHVPDDALLKAAPAARSPRVSAMSHVYDATPPPRPVMAPC